MRVRSLADMRKSKASTGSLPLFEQSSTLIPPLPDYPFDSDSVPDFRFERFLVNAGCRWIAGTDEAGRGPLAGPVVAAAVILPLDIKIGGLNDSKKLNANKRDQLFDVVMQSALAVSVCSISAQTIDQRNIRSASLEAMSNCVGTLSILPDALLVDGRDIPDSLPSNLASRAIIKGDCRSMSIAAAAIIAKVTRDRMMKLLGHEHADYVFESHMGYGSAAHRTKITQLGGVDRVHRFSFRPLKTDE